jgi:hypothetical protein
VVENVKRKIEKKIPKKIIPQIHCAGCGKKIEKQIRKTKSLRSTAPAAGRRSQTAKQLLVLRMRASRSRFIRSILECTMSIMICQNNVKLKEGWPEVHTK